MSNSTENKTILTECNGKKNCKRKRQSSDMEGEEREKTHLVHGAKRWKFDFSPELLEEMGVSIIEWEEPSNEPEAVTKFSTKGGKENVINNNANTKHEVNPCQTAKYVENIKEADSKTKESLVLKEKQMNQLKTEDDDDLLVLSKPKLYVEECEEEEGGEDYFSMLSDEIILMIFSYLRKKQLVTCAQVCKRFQHIAYDDQLWPYLNLSSKTLPPDCIRQVLVRGVIILRLAQSVFQEPIYQPPGLAKNYTSRLQYLDMSMVSISANGLGFILNHCKLLKKLSLEGCEVNAQCLTRISLNNNLEVLNMALVKGIDHAGLDQILNNCRRLQSLNLAWTNLDVASLNILSCRIPSALERLNISGCRKNLTDEHMIEILHRCDDLLELDVSDCLELSDTLLSFITQHVHKLEHLSVSRCYSMSVEALTQIGQLKSLMFLDVFGTMSDSELKKLKEETPSHVTINEFIFSSIARPTVGHRRTSIWGLRVRDL